MSMRLIFLISLVVLAACGPEEPPPPNIIIINADDLGYGDVGPYGQSLIKTPHIDYLAERGMRFTQFYAANALCAPSRLLYLTGRDSRSYETLENGRTQLPDDVVTIPALLREAGYATGLAGKWAFSGAMGPSDPLENGFDYFVGYPNQTAAHNYYPAQLVENGKRFELEGNVLSHQPNISAQRHVFAPDLIHEKALKFLEAHRSEPFYLQMDYTVPHVNNELHAESGNGFEHPGDGRYAEEDWSEADKGYAEQVSLLDDYVGSTLALLDELGLSERTLVLVTSDNGPTGTRGKPSLRRFESSGGFKGMKGMLFEGGIRVPLIAYWPGRISAGRHNTALSAAWDLKATYAELAGVESADLSEGISLVGELLGQEPRVPADRTMVWKVYDRIAVRAGSWKWVRHPRERGNPDFLYDLESDPGEQKNLRDARPDILAKLQSEL